LSTACVVIPDEKFWDPIQKIREKNDKAFKRWMPHISLMFPFVELEDFPTAAKEFYDVLGEMEPFEVVLESIDHFVHSKEIVVFAKPKDSKNLVHLENLIVKVYPHLSDQIREGVFTPHSTLGQFPKKDIGNTIKEISATWKPISYMVNEIFLISRSGVDDPFERIFSIPLGKKAPLKQLKDIQPSTSKKSDISIFVSGLDFKTKEEDLEDFIKKSNISYSKVVVPSNGKKKQRICIYKFSR